MKEFQIETAQNIAIEQNAASIVDRMLGYIIDSAIIYIYIILAYLLLIKLDLDPRDSWAIYLLCSLPAFLYYVLLETFWDGQTVGKSLVKTRVVKLDGSKAGFGNYFVRWILRLVDVVFTSGGLATLTILLKGNGQRVGDLLAGTTVVKIKKITATNVRNKIIMETVDENYVPKLPEAAQLTDHEIRLIKDALSVFRDGAKEKPLLLIEEKLKEKYNRQSDMPTVKFMYTLLRDHTYYMTK